VVIPNGDQCAFSACTISTQNARSWPMRKTIAFVASVSAGFFHLFEAFFAF